MTCSCAFSSRPVGSVTVLPHSELSMLLLSLSIFLSMQMRRVSSSTKSWQLFLRTWYLPPWRPRIQDWTRIAEYVSLASLM